MVAPPLYLLTDWMGDDGWLASLRLELRRFNYLGDLSRVEGTMTGKPREGEVTIRLSIVNQDDVETTSGEPLATALARPAPPHQIGLPVQQRARRHEQLPTTGWRQQARQRADHRSVRPRRPRPCHLRRNTAN
ncbi:hypothetical protein IMZ11_11580 [Microtetraspora sp. AC03309]|uniref:hypothetical protein n=1 Tax=Microtetraspora sp. AC03309 TaxID=2779376 RepID=UPI001E5789C9|nr:hypothetical protein [Microtetraspora sp. AC03309]MCC5576273.1 hypothetical protein [Microtetraspora sp. AC03309]